MIGRTYVVDNERDGLNINTTGEDIGSYEHFGSAGAECVDDYITLARFESTRQAGDFVMFLVEAPLDC